MISKGPAKLCCSFSPGCGSLACPPCPLPLSGLSRCPPLQPSPCSSPWAFLGCTRWQVHLTGRPKVPWAGLTFHLLFSIRAPGSSVELNCQNHTA